MVSRSVPPWIMNIVACVARREWNVTSSRLIFFPRGAELPLDRRRVQDPFRVPDRMEEHRVGIPVGAEPVDMFPDETADRGGDGHDSVAFRGLRLVEPVFAQVVRTLRHGMPHVQQSVFEVNVPELQSADLSDAQPAH